MDVKFIRVAAKDVVITTKFFRAKCKRKIKIERRDERGHVLRCIQLQRCAAKLYGVRAELYYLA